MSALGFTKLRNVFWDFISCAYFSRAVLFYHEIITPYPLSKLPLDYCARPAEVSAALLNDILALIARLIKRRLNKGDSLRTIDLALVPL